METKLSNFSFTLTNLNWKSKSYLTYITTKQFEQ